MEITVETNSYNQRRMGRPWIAKVDFSTPKGEFNWGDWTGDRYNGGEGVLTINADAGDIIAQGQKDTRQPRNSAPIFFLVTNDGQLDELGDKGDAYKYYLKNKDDTTLDFDVLKMERKELLNRVAEIDTIIGITEV